MVVNINRHRTKDFLIESSKNNYERTSGQLTICTTARAVKKVSTSSLVMNSRQLWNSHQRNKFLRAEASKDILQFRVLEMGFLGVFKRYFPLRTPCCFVRIHARLETMLSFHDIVRFEHFTDLNLFKYAFNGKWMLYNFIWWYLFFVSSYGSRR